MTGRVRYPITPTTGKEYACLLVFQETETTEGDEGEEKRRREERRKIFFKSCGRTGQERGEVRRKSALLKSGNGLVWWPRGMRLLVA